MNDDVLVYYGQNKEDERLLAGVGALEFERTKRLLLRVLPERARVVDVGGGTGRYAEWLAERGHEVELVDSTPLHVELARERSRGRFGVHQADARRLPFDDGSFDVALLLGPLYHLEERDARVASLCEAARVVRSGGIVAAAAISRLAPALGSARSGTILDPAVLANVVDETREGRRVPPERRTGLFPRAWFHEPDELRDEMTAAGLEVETLVGVEGPAWLIDGFRALWENAATRDRIIAAAERFEDEPRLTAVSPHMLAVTRKPA